MTTQLALPGIEPTALAAAGVTLSAVGAQGLEDVDATTAGMLLAGVEAASSATNWIVGDLVLEQMLRSRDGDHSLDGVAMPADQAHARRCLLVAVAFDHDRRRPELSWSHHDTVRAMGAEVADDWLERSVDLGWSVAELREQIRAEAERPQPPLPGTRPWAEEHRGTVRALSKAFRQGVEAVVVRADGTWEEWTEETIAPVVDITGGGL